MTGTYSGRVNTNTQSLIEKSCSVHFLFIFPQTNKNSNVVLLVSFLFVAIIGTMAVAAATGGVCLLIALIKFKPFKQQNNIFKQQQPSTRPMPMQRKHRTIYGRALDTKIMVDFHFEIDFFFCRVAIPPTASNKNIFFSGFCCCQPLYVNMNAFPFARTTCNLLRNFWRRMKTKCFTYMPAGKYNGKPARKSFMICVVCKEIRFVVMKVSLPLAERRKCVEWAMQMPSK